MQNDQMNVTELCSGNRRTMAPLFLLQLMRDLALLEEQLRTAEDAMGGPASRYQDPLAERLWRVGVSNQKIENFIAWRRSLSSLVTEGSNDEARLGTIIAAETAGMAVFAELIASIKRGEEHGRRPGPALAA
jgi:hypothetical protein